MRGELGLGLLLLLKQPQHRLVPTSPPSIAHQGASAALLGDI